MLSGDTLWKGRSASAKPPPVRARPYRAVITSPHALRSPLPPPWTIKKHKRVLHCPGQRRAGACIRLFREEPPEPSVAAGQRSCGARSIGPEKTRQMPNSPHLSEMFRLVVVMAYRRALEPTSVRPRRLDHPPSSQAVIEPLFICSRPSFRPLPRFKVDPRSASSALSTTMSRASPAARWCSNARNVMGSDCYDR